MELKPGYKQTEVGVIPEDWEVRLLNNLIRPDAPICYGILMPGTHVHNGTPVIKVKDMVQGRIDESGILFTHPDIDNAYKRSRLEEDDVLISIRGTTGRVAVVPATLTGANITQDTARLRVGKDVMPKFLYHVLQGDLSQQQIALNTIGQAVKGINIRDIKALAILVPCPEEQRRIASALSELDALLESLQSLIIKKRNIKQAAMQELLTGKRRLPGFEGEWEVKRLGSVISDLEAGVSVVSLQGNDQPSTGRFVLKTSAVTNGQLIASESKEITPTDLSRAKTSIKKDDLIISRMNTPALVGECGYAESDFPHLFLPDRLWRVSYRNPATVSSRWLAYLLSYDQNKARIKELATGTSGSMKNISKHALLSLRIQWPTLAEQRAIAECLSSLDDELKALSSRLDKTRALKQAMMQELLTGRIRLR